LDFIEFDVEKIKQNSMRQVRVQRLRLEPWQYT